MNSIEISERIAKQVREGFTRRQHDINVCMDCNSWTHIWMVDNELWKSLSLETEVFCLPCFEKRLGRKINIHDLQAVPCNLPYFYGFQMSKK